jgi:succinate dehydrogenase / fumarate reductase, cytochrome b subunit
MSIIKGLFQSSVGRKLIMAATGAVLVLFVVGHLVGNLQIFLGAEAINRYGHLLQTNQELLWPVRLVLLTTLVLHVWSAVVLSLENRAARPLGYVGNPTPQAASYASRTMLVGGLIVAVFIVYHLLHYTLCVPAINLTGRDFASLQETLKDGTERHDVFRMMVLGFRQPLVSAFYLLGVGLVCLHLSHGIQAMCQSLGLRSGTWTPAVEKASLALAWILFLGYASIPLAILLGYGKEFVN